MSKLVSQKHNKVYAGQKITFPIVGTKSFSEDGSIEIEDSKVEELIEATKESFDFVVVESAESKPEGGKQDLESEDVIKWKELLAGASNKELVEMAIEAKLGKPEKIASMTDEKLRAELLKKMTASEKK